MTNHRFKQSHNTLLLARRNKMHNMQRITVAAVAAVLVGVILPALAAVPDGMDSMRSEGRSGMRQGMMSGGGMMTGGCANMMQSMNGGDRRPNSQWHKPLPGNSAPD
jgi:hypothetical protein